MRPPAESSLDSPHAVFSRRQHVGEKTRESTRKTSKNLENPPKIDMKSMKISLGAPGEAMQGEATRSEAMRGEARRGPARAGEARGGVSHPRAVSGGKGEGSTRL